MATKRNENPSITVGIIVLNREWVIGKALNSVLSQTYPHDKIFVLIVDGGSRDRTVEVAKEILEKSDFRGYEIVTIKPSIAEARNVCLEKAREDMLLFWDSDVVMEPDAMYKILDTMEKQNADIVSGDALFVHADSEEDIDTSIEEAMGQARENSVQEVFAVGMGHTLISRNVLKSNLKFDPDLAVSEDQDFSARVVNRGFKITIDKRIHIVDVNVRSKGFSDMNVDASLRNVTRALRKKARAQVLAYRSFWTFSGEIKFLWSNKRYIFYLGYIPTAVLTAIGIFLRSPLLITVFPAYLLLYTLWQTMRRGIRRGTKAVSRSFIVGVPYSLWLIYYYSGNVLKKKVTRKT